MPDSDVATVINSSLDGLRLLDHPYYRSWQQGSLAEGDLGRYAEQYRHFERSLPEVLATVAGGLPAGPSRVLVESNLDDEKGRPRPHVELFEEFAGAVGAASEVRPTAATQQLVDLYRAAAEEGPVPALAVIAAYEAQAGEIAATKAASLSDHYDLDASSTEFWTVHAGMEQTHAAWTTDALAHLGADPETVREWSGRSAAAWWAFLDERDSERVDSSSLPVATAHVTS